jgi:hypothetical protein
MVNDLTARIAAWQSKVDSDGIGLIPELRAAARDQLRTRAQAMLQQGTPVAEVAKRLGVTSELLGGVLPAPPPKPELPKLVITDEDLAANRQLKADIQTVRDELRRLGR